MRIKNLILSLTAVVLAAPAALAGNDGSDSMEQDVLYVATNANYYYISAKEGDPYLVLNPETGWYEGVTITTTGKNYGWKFYTKDANGNITWYGALIVSGINFLTTNPYTGTYFSGGKIDFGSSAWYAKTYLPDANVTVADISLAVNLTTGEVKFEQVNIPEVIPEAYYVWGNITGPGNTYRNYGTLVPSQTNTDLYEAILDVPEVAEGTMTEDDEPVPGFLFSIGNSATSYAPITIFNAEYASQGNPTTFDFSNEKSMTVRLYGGTIAPNGNPLSSMYDVTPGSTLFSFDYKTLELTLTYLGEETGISDVAGENAEGYTAVTLQGITVLRGATATDVDRLPAGIYIINGKKTVVRK